MLTASRLQDPPEKIRFVDGRWLQVPGGCGVVEHENGTVYLAMALRNVGRGLAVLHGWQVRVGLQSGADQHPEPGFASGRPTSTRT
jgi:hypothetical protein